VTLELAIAWSAFVGAIVTWHHLARHRDPDELHQDDRVIRNVRWP
jgi:hypothetical protein